MIEFKNVSKTYSNGTHALQNVNLTVADGEFVFIVGSSGAGKSTFLKLIMCEETPNEGEIKKRVPYILSLLNLQDKQKCRPNELSGGEQQRVGLARALVNNPKLIIADEPTGNIDPALSFEIVDLLSEINRRGTTILMVTHEHSLVKHFHKRVVEIHDGRIVADTASMEVEPDAQD